MRSTSKVVAPGLRIGWTEGPPWLIGAMEIAKQSADLDTSTLSQAIVTDLLSDRVWFDGHVAMVRDQYRLRRDALCEALDGVFGDRVTFRRPEGGMFLWATFVGVDTGSLLPPALEEGVAFVPANAFAVDQQRPHTARLSFATVDPEDFAVAAQRLAAAIESC